MHEESRGYKEGAVITGMKLFVPLLCLAMVSIAPAGGRDVLVVDATGKGQFRTIQEAIQAIPPDNAENRVILIRNGIYREKLFITTSHLSLVGENRDSTRVIYAELRSNWTGTRDNRPDGSQVDLDWGAGVINIGNGVSDVILANMTVHNNYGSLHGDRSHQFAIRGFRATRISILNCNVIADGGDTVSLWNSDSGLYYHANSYFEGWVDYLCPRGWCYITDSRFFGHNTPSASFWHDGSKDKDQKLVIRNSWIDGVPGFPLGRHHRDGQLYFLYCTFSKNMADRPIYFPTTSPNAVPWRWGARHYFYSCTREGGMYDWLADNLHEAERSPSPKDITAAWTFAGRWDPESTLPPVLPFAAIPQPSNNAYAVPTSGILLQWIPGRDGLTQVVYFGETDPPPTKREQSDAHYATGPLKPSTRYYWKVDVVTPKGTIPGEVWQFRTAGSIPIGIKKEKGL